MFFVFKLFAHMGIRDVSRNVLRFIFASVINNYVIIFIYLDELVCGMLF